MNSMVRAVPHRSPRRLLVHHMSSKERQKHQKSSKKLVVLHRSLKTVVAYCMNWKVTQKRKEALLEHHKNLEKMELDRDQGGLKGLHKNLKGWTTQGWFHSSPLPVGNCASR